MTSIPDIPSNEEVQNEADPVRRALLAGMQRVLLRRPRLVAPGAVTFSDLAAESEVPRHHLYQTHPDLRERFEFLRDRGSTPTPTELALQKRLNSISAELAEQKIALSQTREEGRNWKGLAETFARAINVLQEELRREQIKSTRLQKKVARLEQNSSGAPVIPIRPIGR